MLTPIFKFSSDIRKVTYTTNVIESLNSMYKKLNQQRSVFPNDKALLKTLYLRLFRRRRNGHIHLGTGARYMVGLPSYTRIECLFRNLFIYGIRAPSCEGVLDILLIIDYINYSQISLNFQCFIIAKLP